VRGSFQAVIFDAASSLESAGDFLGVIALYAGSQRKIRRATEHQVKLFVGGNNGVPSEITEPYVKAIFEPVVAGGFAGQRDTGLLGFNGDEFCACQTPSRDHGHASDAASEV
jgi:hypothetical protein